MPRPVRSVAYLALLLLAAVWLAVRFEPPQPAPAADADRDVTTTRMEEMLGSLRATLATDPDTVIVLGDSAFLDHLTLPRGQTLAFLLETEAPQAGLSIRVVAYAGFDPIAYYLLADALAALRPRAVLLTANLQAFTDSWFRNPRMKHPQLAAFVRPTRVPEAMALPLELAGISDSSLVTKPLLRLLRATDVPEILDGYRERFRAELDQALGALSVTAADGGPATANAEVPGSPRSGGLTPPPTAGGAPRQTVGSAPNMAVRRGGRKGARAGTWSTSPFRRLDLYPDHLDRTQASVRVLAATVRDLVADGVPTVVAIAPLHLQALRLTGAYQSRDIAAAVVLIRDVIVESGATPLDLTQALPLESYFADAHTHFTAEGNRIVAAQIIAGLRRLLDAGS